MATTVNSIVKSLVEIAEEISGQADMALPAGRTKREKAQIYKYFYPIKIGNKLKNLREMPYIVIGVKEEKQTLWNDVDESELTLEISVGFCMDDDDLDVGKAADILFSALERLEIEIKNITLLEGTAMLQEVKKQIPVEQPLPFLEGRLSLVYKYYKAIMLEEP